MSKAPIKHSCLWTDTFVNLQRYPCLQNEITADVCIIGGGYTGFSTAIHLAEKGIKVCLLEGKYIGAGGSGRNVGYVNAGMWMKPNDVEKTLGKAVGSKLNAILDNAPQLVFDLIKRYNIDAQATQTGNLQLAHNAATDADIRDRYQQWQARGASVQLISGSAACEHIVGTKRIKLALLDKRSGTINPYAYLVGLAKTASCLSVEIYENTPVVQLHQAQKGGQRQWQISTQNGAVVFADKVVLATNAYTEGEWTKIKKTMFMVNYFQIASEPLDSDAAAKILPGKQGAADTQTVLSSFRRDKDKRLLLGTVGNGEGKPEWFFRTWANRITTHYFPELGKVNWQYQWSGKFGFTSDHLFRLLTPAPGVLAATAFNGRGITTGTVIGKAFADYLLSDNEETLPMPLTTLAENILPFRKTRACYYEAGVTLYHAGQCLRII